MANGPVSQNAGMRDALLDLDPGFSQEFVTDLRRTVQTALNLASDIKGFASTSSTTLLKLIGEIQHDPSNSKTNTNSIIDWLESWQSVVKIRLEPLIKEGSCANEVSDHVKAYQTLTLGKLEAAKNALTQFNESSDKTTEEQIGLIQEAILALKPLTSEKADNNLGAIRSMDRMAESMRVASLVEQ
ncbi:MAG: hypothetical protein ACK5Y6_10340 [Pseudomonadota bacterium]